jgi:hypothetical protein
MRIEGTGNVGIGTASPTNSTNYNTLDIRGTNGGQIIAGRVAYQDFFMYTTNSAANIGALNDLSFKAGTTGSMSTPSLYLKDGGSVGIGTASPSGKLHVATTSGDPINIALQNSERYWKMQTDAGLLTFNDVSAGDLARMTLDTGGDVGIGTGTTSPASRLEIKDNASNNYSTQMRLSQGYSTVYSTIGSNFGGAMTINAGQGSTTANLNFSLNGTNRMKIDVNGRVTMPYQPAFKAAWGSRAATGSGRLLSTNASDTLATGRDEFNTGSHFSTATGKFTAPVAGTYVLGFQAMRHGNNGSALECRIKKNGGAMWARAYQGAFDQAHQYWSIVTTTKCAAGDYFQVYIGPSTSIYNDDTYFYGHLIG